jgi:hypothetical protein
MNVMTDPKKAQYLLTLARIIITLVGDPVSNPNPSYSVASLTDELKQAGYSVNEAKVLGYLMRLKDAGLLTINAVGEYGEPYICLS